MVDDAHLAQLVIHLKVGKFTDEERSALVNAFRESELGEVRVDEQIVSNLGIGGPGGLPINVDVWLNVAEGAAAALLAVVIQSGVAVLVKVIGKRLVRLVSTIRTPESKDVTYIVDGPQTIDAVDAIPADYEVAIRTESRTRVWRDGRWERYESTTKTELGHD
ncbi:MAG: hypothetical protein E6J20_03975 [Chloroflexi bacterium]|nr:MAG: hypothetical protein E6J20_03975 [Chloroflexota bacterium]